MLKRLPRKPEPEGLLRLEQQLAERIPTVDIIDALSDTEHWLNWSRYFELCVFSNVMLELKSGDLCVPGSDRFSDYRKELVGG